MAPSSSAQTGPPTESQIKAAFIYNFAKFIEWPHMEPDEEFRIGIVGRDPFGRDIDLVLSGKTVQDRPVRILRFATAQEVRHCHLFFVAPDTERYLGLIRGKFPGRGIVFVGDSSSFLASGGTINFLIEDNKVRFEMSRKASEEAGVKVSSQLLKVARLVD